MHQILLFADISERRKDERESGYGTLHERLGADSIKEFDWLFADVTTVSRTGWLLPMDIYSIRKPSSSYILNHKKENQRQLKEWQKSSANANDVRPKKYAEFWKVPSPPGFLWLQN